MNYKPSSEIQRDAEEANRNIDRCLNWRMKQAQMELNTSP